MNDGLKTVSE